MRWMGMAVWAWVGCAEGEPEEVVDTGADDTDVGTMGWEVATRAPFAPPAADPLADAPVDGCDVIEATTCEEGRSYRCAPYDVVEGEFPEEIDPLRRRAWLYDRFYDLHHSPDGQTSDREMLDGFPPGTPESVWADPEAFAEWDGFGDSAIWTGVATHGAMQRWLATGTEADRLRFETKVRAMLTQFEVTDAVGFLARAHFLIVPDGTAPVPEHLTLTETQVDDPIRFEARDPSAAPDLPAAYAGQRVGWQGNPSIDQYTGAMVTLPAAWELLDDPDLRDRIEAQLVGYLHRLERVELQNFQANPELLAAAAAALGGAVDLEDIGLDDLDTLVLYVLPSYNRTNEDVYPRLAPEAFPRDAVTVLDAGDSAFLVDLLALATRLERGAKDGWDHVYAPSVRGGDAVHMMHLALMAWHMTGEQRYLDFLTDELLDTIGTHDVANTLGVLVLPHWCRSHFGDHITLPPLWALLNLLDEGPLRQHLVRAMVEEGQGRLNDGLGNAKFDLMVADALDPDDPLRTTLHAQAAGWLRELGGNGGVLDEPRRTYTITVEDLEDGLGTPLPLMCPTDAQRAQCEDGFQVLGITVPGEEISFPCIGHPLECDFGDGTCAWALSSEPLPMDLRRWQDFLWQRSPNELGALYDPEGRKSSPGLDLTESYWLAVNRGALPEQDVVLAWEDVGGCDE